MSNPSEVEYIALLEVVVAVLAVKLGMNPETMMANAIEDIASQMGMSDRDATRLIQSRWKNRNLASLTKVAGQVSGNRSLENEKIETPVPKLPDPATALQDYLARVKG